MSTINSASENEKAPDVNQGQLSDNTNDVHNLTSDDANASGSDAALAASFDPMMSFFSSFKETIPVENVPLSEIIRHICSGEWATITAQIATAYAAAGGGEKGKKAIAELKKTLPAVTLGGIFSPRAKAHWEKSSALVQFDIDKLTKEEMASARGQLTACPWVACLWASPSGAGLKGAVRVPDMTDPAQYETAWRAVTQWLKSLGLINDPAAKDCSRLAFLAHDPHAWCRASVEVFDLAQWPEPVPQVSREKATQITQINFQPSAEVERRALACVRAMPESREGNNGSAAMMAVVRDLHDGFALDDASFWRCLEIWNKERASPEWPRDELERALSNVKSTPSTHERGWLLKNGENEIVPSWPALVRLHVTAEPPPFDPLTMFPADLPDLSAMAHAVAEAVQVPLAMVAGALVGLAALACSRAVEVRLSPEWQEPAPLWVIALMRPGERKSACIGKLKSPFSVWMTQERKLLAEPLARFAERRRTTDARLAAVRGKAAKATTSEQREKLEAEASDLAAVLATMPEKMAAPDLLVQSFTPEALRDTLEMNGEKLGIVSAECDAGELMGARYSDAGPNLDILLAAHSGDQLTTRRAGGRVIPLERPALGLVLAIQPEAMRSVLGDRAAHGRGLVDRMLLIHPPSRMGSRVNDSPTVPQNLTEWWNSAITTTLDLPWPGRVIVGYGGEPVRETSPARILSISPEAKDILWALRESVEPRLEEGADLAAVSGFGSKLHGACARLALAFTILRNPQADVVEAEAMRAACAWAPFLLAHHRSVLGDAAKSPEAHHANRLWKALKRHGEPVMTARNLCELVRDSALSDMASFRPVLALLAEHNAVRPQSPQNESQGKTGRKPDLWEIHPDLLPKVDLRDLRDNSEGRLAS